MKTLILWSGAVVPAYRQFFQDLAVYMQVRALAPKRWTHGSIRFQRPTENHRVNKYRHSNLASNFKCEIVPATYFPESSARYFVPSLIFHLWAFRPRYLYIMDEMDRISLTWHALIAKFAWPRVKIISYSLQNLVEPTYYRWHHRLALRLNHKLVSRGIAASREVQQVIHEHGFQGPTCVIPLWGAESFFHPCERPLAQSYRNSLGIPDDAIVLLFCGSLVTAKGLQLLLETLPLHPKIKFLTAGLGPLEDVLRKGLGRQYVPMGRLEGESLRRFYQSGDYIILPSLTLPHWKEQVGRSLIEGILCHCIALGSDSGHIPELTLFSETTFAEGNAQSLNKLLGSLPLPEAHSIRMAQHQNVKEHFTSAAVALLTYKFLAEKI